MPQILKNPFRGEAMSLDVPLPKHDPSRVADLLRQCPVHVETPLVACPELARIAGAQAIWLKDERARMGLGSFKALGASFALAHAAAEEQPVDWSAALTGRCFVAASAGNHGLSVAAGARVFGAEAVIFIAETVPEAFAQRLQAYGATVKRQGQDYQSSMAAAEAYGARTQATLLSDSTWPGYSKPAMRVMEGYLQMAAETVRQIPERPTHILLQAGVGGMAAAMAAHFREAWGQAVEILVIEPDDAPALQASIRAGKPITTEGPVSNMGRLDCKTPSLVALAGLSRDADTFVTLSDTEAEIGVAALNACGLATTPSGGAGVAALLAGLTLGPDARILAFLTEGPEDG